MESRVLSHPGAMAVWQLFRVAVVAYSALALASFGFQVVLAPILLPIQWGIAKVSNRPWQLVLAWLAGALCGEVAWLVAGQLGAATVPSLFVGAAAAVGAGVLFVRTTAIDS